MASEDTDSQSATEDDFKTNLKLERPPGLPRIVSQDDLSIKQEKNLKKHKKKLYPLTPNPTSNTKKKRNKKTVQYDNIKDQKILELEAKIKSLTRDNRVIQRKLEKIELSTGKKQKKMDTEREMRLAANKERFTLQTKLSKLQKNISVRLKLLGVDFSKIDDITTALDLAFNVIQKLAKQLQEKEEELNILKIKLTSYPKIKQQLNELTLKNKNLIEHQQQLNIQINALTQTNNNFIQSAEKSTQQINELQENMTVFKNDLDGLKHENMKLIQQNEALLSSKTELESDLNNLENELNELNEINKKYKNEGKEYESSIKILESKIKEFVDEKQKERKYVDRINVLEDEIEGRDKVIELQTNKMETLQKEMEMASFGDNKKFSQMSLLKKNVEKMHNIIRDKDNQIKMLTNKLNSAQKELMIFKQSN